MRHELDLRTTCGRAGDASWRRVLASAGIWWCRGMLDSTGQGVMASSSSVLKDDDDDEGQSLARWCNLPWPDMVLVCLYRGSRLVMSLVDRGGGPWWWCCRVSEDEAR